jgi:hypothetical protein
VDERVGRAAPDGLRLLGQAPVELAAAEVVKEPGYGHGRRQRRPTKGFPGHLASPPIRQGQSGVKTSCNKVDGSVGASSIQALRACRNHRDI